MKINPDGTWTVEMTDSPRFHFHDTFRVKAEEKRTCLIIHQVITAKDPASASQIPELKKEIVDLFKTISQMCERDAPFGVHFYSLEE